jgi:predicted dehydrogenase
MKQSSTRISRRKFVKTAAATGAAFAIVPRHVLGRGFTPPSDLLNVAGVGVGGMGRSNMINLASQNIVAMCDVDWGYANKGFEGLDANIKGLETRIEQGPPPPRPGQPPVEFNRERAMAQLSNLKRLKEEHLPKLKKYTDYREMLEKQKDIEGVVIATPDHMHAAIAAAAMDLGKHVYVQKPLTWSVAEARLLARKSAENPKLATQMGNQGHSFDDARKVIEYVWAGAIGDVREVHVWTNRPLGYWPQGIPRPQPVDPDKPIPPNQWNNQAIMRRLASAMGGNYPVPDGLAWDLFLGVAPYVEYHPVYHPFNWRGWVDWGQGALGDMGAHLIDHPFWSLKLGLPTSIETVSTPFNNASYPHATTTYYEFAARENMPPVKLTWYDGGLLPPKPPELGDDEKVDPGGGVMFIGSKGKLMHETYGLHPRLLPKSLHESVGTPPQKLPRIPNEAHELNWADAAKGKTQPSCPFSYATRLTETMLLGVVALKAGSKIYYDGENMRVTNSAKANDYLRREPRNGWTL